LRRNLRSPQSRPPRSDFNLSGDEPLTREEVVNERKESGWPKGTGDRRRARHRGSKLQAYAAYSLLQTPPRKVGFASGCQAFGHRELLGQLRSFGLVMNPILTVHT